MRVAKLTPTIGRVKEDIDRVFDRFFPAPFLTEPMAPLFPFEETGPAGALWTPMLDVIERETEYVVRLEVPGIHKENLDIKLTGNVLTIKGHREDIQEGAGETYLWRERDAGRFVRALRLPETIEEAKVEATYQDGILTVHVPKKAAAVANQILIK
jgi:HSP20 family protein